MYILALIIFVGIKRKIYKNLFAKNILHGRYVEWKSFFVFTQYIDTVVFFTVLSYSNHADLVRRSIGISEIVIPMTRTDKSKYIIRNQ